MLLKVKDSKSLGLEQNADLQTKIVAFHIASQISFGKLKSIHENRKKSFPINSIVR